MSTPGGITQPDCQILLGIPRQGLPYPWDAYVYIQTVGGTWVQQLSVYLAVITMGAAAGNAAGVAAGTGRACTGVGAGSWTGTWAWGGILVVQAAVGLRKS